LLRRSPVGEHRQVFLCAVDGPKAGAANTGPKRSNGEESAKIASKGRIEGAFFPQKIGVCFRVALDRTAFPTSYISGEVPMFDSLDDQMRRDEDKVSSSKERMMRWALYVLAAGIVFGGLIIGVHYMG
jgi:hypothetical protein